jgi:FkbM family methyltransferase
MNFRARIKHSLYGYCPGVRGSFRYFGKKVYFPHGSASFWNACEQGIFENDNVRLIQGLVRPGTWYFDVGANIGLMALPFLASTPDLRVASFEPSPNSLHWLKRTVRESGYADRWVLIEKALGPKTQKVSFFLSTSRYSLFDGLRPTNRTPLASNIEVEQTTLDAEWRALGSPDVSVIKCDVEGGELGVLRGAQTLITTCSPALLLEWNADNLRAYNEPIDAILPVAKDLRYGVYSVPGCVPVRSAFELRAHMAFTESFLLLPVALQIGQ